MKKLIAISILLTAFIGSAVAQSNTQSRLNIGVKPKVPNSVSNVNVIGVSPLKEKIELNEKDAILNFYKNILLNPTKKKPAQKNEVYSVPERNDALFSDNDVFVKNMYDLITLISYF